MKIWAITALVLAATVRAEEKVHHYTLEGYPTTAGACHGLALDLGKAFAAATALSVVDALCVAEGTNGYDIRIRYRAEKPVKPVTTHIHTLAPGGRFKDRAACEKALPAEKAAFAEHTGLAPVFAYCTVDPYSHRIPWTVRMDGFGDAELAPQRSGFYLFSQPKELTGKDLVEGLRQALAAHGAVLADVVAHSQLSHAEVSVHYYAEKSHKLELREYGKLDRLEQCRGQLGELRAGFNSVKNLPAALFCGYVHVGGAYESTALFVGMPSLKNRNSIERYKSFNECEAARPALVEYYQQKLNADVRASLCTRDYRDFRVMLFEPY